MPREMLSTNAPLSAAGSAAQLAGGDEDYSGAFIGSAEADRVKTKLRVVAGGAPVIEPAVQSAAYPIAARASSAGGEVLAQDWAQDWAEDWAEDPPDFPETRADAKLEERGSKAAFLTVVDKKNGQAKPRAGARAKAATRREPRRPGLKKPSKKEIAQDWPPTPRGCQWRRTEDGLNLWRCWTDWDDDKTKKIKKSRYAGHLSDDAWRIMKEYDYEAFISVVGERLRRHGGR
ncbi:MAG TPA: hypothetical protein VFS27_11175 [Blastocatellia bacterium]|jgi:hypothetical protein|nr:hypothetical protein [Blastocatellia bacterium]